MDITRFSSKSPGRLVAIAGGDRAFIPAPLPAKWKFPERLWPVLADAKQQLGILEGLGRNLPNPAILLRPLRDREAILSSRLEGTYVTAKELLLFEKQPRPSKSVSDPANDWLEVYNYGLALKQGMDSNLPLSLRLVRDLHAVLMNGVRGKDARPGEFRDHQVAIGTYKRFIPPPPLEAIKCLYAFEEYLNSPVTTHDPLVDCFIVHYQFEAIHPFGDGNGRVGRLLLAIMFRERCCLTKPWLYMSEFFDRNREQYFGRLFEVSASADWNGWIGFCLQGVVEQATDTIRRCERLLSLREEFLRRVQETGGSVRLTAIIDSVFEDPFIEISALKSNLKITYPTAKSDLERLAEIGILQELPGHTPRTFYAPQIFEIAYEGS